MVNCNQALRFQAAEKTGEELRRFNAALLVEDKDTFTRAEIIVSWETSTVQDIAETMTLSWGLIIRTTVNFPFQTTEQPLSDYPRYELRQYTTSVRHQPLSRTAPATQLAPAHSRNPQVAFLLRL